MRRWLAERIRMARMDDAEYDKLKAEWIMEMLDAMPRLHESPAQCPKMGWRGAKGPLAYVLLYGSVGLWPWLCELDARATIWRAACITDEDEQHQLIPEIDHLPLYPASRSRRLLRALTSRKPARKVLMPG
jgi:hypothetical protein